MRHSLNLFAAATLAAGTLAYMGYDRSVLAADEQARGAGASGQVTAGGAGARASGRMSLPQGITPSQQSDRQGIQKTLGAVTEAALQPGTQINLSQYLASSDRTRLSRIQGDQIQQQLDQLRQAYRQKYNKEVEIQEEIVFGEQFKNFEIVQGEVSNPALLSNWPIQSPSTTTNIRTGPGSPRSETGTGTSRDQADVGRPGSPPNQITPDRSNTGAGTQRRDTGSETTPRSDARDQASPGGPGQPSNVGVSGRDASTAADRTSRAENTPPANSRDRASAGGPGEPSDVGVAGQPGARTAGGSTTILGEPARTGAPAGATGLNRGMNVAIVTFPASHGAPELTVSLVRESATAGGAGAPGAGAPGSLDINGRSSGIGATGSASADRSGVVAGGNTGSSGTAGASGQSPAGRTGAPGAAGTPGAAAAAGGDWKIDVPDQLTADQLQRNLQKHLTEVNQMKDQWPQDATEAQRMISHHVLMAFYDTGAQAGPGATGGTRGGASGTGSDRGTSGSTGSGTSGSTGSGTSGSGTSGGTSGTSGTSGSSSTARDPQ